MSAFVRLRESKVRRYFMVRPLDLRQNRNSRSRDTARQQQLQEYVMRTNTFAGIGVAALIALLLPPDTASAQRFDAGLRGIGLEAATPVYWRGGWRGVGWRGGWGLRRGLGWGAAAVGAGIVAGSYRYGAYPYSGYYATSYYPTGYYYPNYYRRYPTGYDNNTPTYNGSRYYYGYGGCAAWC
jgi:hypothetical protein